MEKNMENICVCIFITEAACCATETNTTLRIDFTLIKSTKKV